MPDGSCLGLWPRLSAPGMVETAAPRSEWSVGRKEVLETSTDYAKPPPFGKPIGIYHAVSHQARLHARALGESAARATYYAAWAVRRTAPDRSDGASMARLTSPTPTKDRGDGIRLHCGIGFTGTTTCHLYFSMRAKSSEVTLGDATTTGTGGSSTRPVVEFRPVCTNGVSRALEAHVLYKQALSRPLFRRNTTFRIIAQVRMTHAAEQGP